MIQQRSLSLLSSAERHLLRQNKRQAAQCLRCFHSSKPTLAEESKPAGNDNGTPYNTPKRGPNRQERAAKVSSEVSALAPDLPKANLSGRNAEVEGAQPRNPRVSPQSQGKDVGSGRMGENDGPRKEGPFAQGVGRVVRESEEDPSASKQAQGIRTPNSKLETPSEGGASVMEPMGAGAPEAPVSSDPNAGTTEAPIAATTTAAAPTTAKPVAPAKPTNPKSRNAVDYLSTGSGTSTLLSTNIPGMIQDRANLLSPRSTPSAPTHSEIAHRLRHYKTQLVAFRSQAEKEMYLRGSQSKRSRDALEANKKKLEQRANKEKKEHGKATKQTLQEIFAVNRQLTKQTRWVPLPQPVQQGIIDRMVLGKYDAQGLLSGKQVHRQPQLNTVAQELLKNSTYLAKDSQKLISKLRGLLPTAAAAKAPAAKAKA